MKQQLLFLVMTLLPMAANAHDIEVQNADGVTIYYNYINNRTELAVTHCGKFYNSVSSEYGGNVVIPEEVTYKDKTCKVTSIENHAFYECPSLTSVIIPNSVTSIGSYAFEYCSRLTSVIIPNSVTSINNGTFQNSHSLTFIIIPNSVTNIGDSAFSGCYGLTSVTIPNSVTSIGNYAFKDCTNLTSVTIPNSVTSIGYYAFSGCYGLTSVTIPNSVTNIADGTFDHCGLTSVTIPNSVMSIGPCAFEYCSKLTSVIIPHSVTSIAELAFFCCDKLTSFVIGSGVTSISSNAFNFTNLKKVIWLTNTPPTGYNYVSGVVNYVPNDNFTSLSNKIVYPFLSSYFEVNGIRYVPVSPSERTCDAIDCVYDSTAHNTVIASTVSYKGISMDVKNIQPYLAYNNIFIESLNVDIDGKVSEYAFTGCSNMSTATLGEKVNAIDQYAFQGCSKLLRIVIPNSVKSIGNYSFSDCSTLEYAKIGKGIGIINDYAFSGCFSLPKITIPGCVSSISSCVFQGCKSLKEVGMENRAEGQIIESYENWIYSSDNSQITINVSAGDTLSFDYEVTNGSLRVYQPDHSFTTFQGTGSYYGVCCSSGMITLYCKTNSSTTVPFCGVTNIKLSKSSGLFLGSNGDSPLFADCPLDSVYIGRNISYNKNANSGYSPFYRNTTLRSVVITDKEEEISENEFYGCSNLQRVMIGDGVTTIRDYAFSGCQSLKFFTFGNQVKTIGKEAFSDCTSVEKIASKAQTPPTCGTQALDDINKWNCKLFVPKGCIAAYQAADQWKDFFFTEEGDGSGGEGSSETETKKCEKPTISYTNGQLSFGSETKGAEFITDITDSDIKRYYDANIQLTATYTISVYATKAGYDNSDVATATLCWIDVEPKTEGISDGIAQVPAKAVLIQAVGGSINVQGCDEGERVGVYSINGSHVGTAVSQNGAATVNTTLQPGSVAIIKVGEKSIKVVVQ